MIPALIGLYSPTMACGKTTVATYLGKKVYHVLSFARPMKLMVRSLLDSAGYTQEQIERMLAGDLKEEGCLWGNKSPRHILQTLGTEWGRNLIDPNIWVDVCMRKAHQMGCPVVIDDVRFPNEYQAIKNAGGTLIKILRPGNNMTVKHESEGALNDYEFDYTITNDGTVEDLKKKVYDAILNKEYTHG